jgi:hypothetical protein
MPVKSRPLHDPSRLFPSFRRSTDTLICRKPDQPPRRRTPHWAKALGGDVAQDHDTDEYLWALAGKRLPESQRGDVNNTTRRASMLGLFKKTFEKARTPVYVIREASTMG